LDLDLDLVLDVDGLVRCRLSRHNIYQISLYLYMSTSKSGTEGQGVSRKKRISKHPRQSLRGFSLFDKNLFGREPSRWGGLRSFQSQRFPIA
jgi:hypothetical protein